MICKLPPWLTLAVLLVIAGWTTQAGGIVNVGSAGSFTYICNVPDMMANATEVDNLEYDDMGLSLRTANWGWANRYSYVMWHFKTGNAGTTFGTDLKISGRYNNIDPGWSDCAAFVLASTSSSTPVYQWAAVKQFYGVQNDATWTLENLGAQFGGGTDLYVAVAIRTPSTNTGNRMLAQLFRSVDGAHPFVLTGSLNSTSQAKEAVNLLSEPDFEETTAGNWVWSKNLTPTATWAMTAAQKYSGAQSVKFTYGSAYKTSRWARFTQTVPVHANSAYEFSAYVKGTSVTASGAALAAGTNAATRVYFPSGTYGWTPYSLTIDTGANTSLPFMFHLERPVTELDVDNVKLTEIFLGNSGFENSASSPAPWGYYVQNSPINSGTVVSGVAGANGKCFKFTYGSAENGDDGAFLIQYVSNLRPNTRYVAEVRYKGTGVGWASMITGLNWTIFKFFPTGDTTDWTKMVMPFETDGTGATWPFIVLLKSTTTELYVDEIKIYRDGDYNSRDAAADSGNLIKGPSFEKATDLRVGDYTRWWLSQGANGGDATAAIVTTESLKGGKALRLAGNTAPWGDNKHSALLQWADNLSANTTYRLTAFVKGTDVREACLMANWTNRAYLPFGTYDWTLVSLDFTTGATPGSVTVGVMALNRMTSLCVDNVSLRPLAKTTAAPLIGSDIASAHGVHPCDDASGNEFPLLAGQGFSWARYDMRWNEIETTLTTPATYDWTRLDGLAANADAAGMKLWLILSYGNALYDHDTAGLEIAPCTTAGRQAFAAWAQAAMQRYRGKGYIFELYNEPNGSFWKPKPKVADYIALASTVGALVRADPLISNECLVLPGLAALFDVNVDYGFAIPLLQSGVGSYFDGFSMHPYRDDKPETVGPDYRLLQQLINRYYPDRSLPVITGEIGYESGSSLGEAGQANYYGRLFLQGLLAKTPLNVWYNSHDTSWNGSFGLLRINDRSAKPAWTVAGQIDAHLGSRALCWRVAPASTLEPAAVDPEVYILRFTGDAYAVWSSNGSKTVTLPLTSITGGTYGWYDQFGTHVGNIATTTVGLTVTATEEIHYLHLQ